MVKNYTLSTCWMGKEQYDRFVSTMNEWQERIHGTKVSKKGPLQSLTTAINILENGRIKDTQIMDSIFGTGKSQGFLHYV